MFNEEIIKLADFLEQDKKHCFAISYTDDILEEYNLIDVRPDNVGKKRFLEQVKKAVALGAEVLIVEIFEKRDNECSARPKIKKRIRIKETAPIRQDLLGELGGLQGYIQTSISVQGLKTENAFLRNEKEKLERQINDLKDQIKRLEDKVERFKEENQNLKWQLREREIKGQNKILEQLGSLAIGFLGVQVPTSNQQIKTLNSENNEPTNNKRTTVPNNSGSNVTGTASLRLANSDQIES